MRTYVILLVLFFICPFVASATTLNDLQSELTGLSSTGPSGGDIDPAISALVQAILNPTPVAQSGVASSTAPSAASGEPHLVVPTLAEQTMIHTMVGSLIGPPAIALTPLAQSAEENAPENTADQNASTTDPASLIASLQSQIQTLMAQISSFSSLSGASSTSAIDLGASNLIAAPACPTFTHTMGKGDTDRTKNGEISMLQQFLKDQGIFTGDVTGYFGALTEAALEAWQSTHAIVSSGTPATTGYGYFGPQTRAALAASCMPAASQEVSESDDASSQAVAPDSNMAPPDMGAPDASAIDQPTDSMATSSDLNTTNLDTSTTLETRTVEATASTTSTTDASIYLHADPNPVTYGATAVLAWRSDFATKDCHIDGSDGFALSALPSQGTRLSSAVTAERVYTLTCTADDATTRSASVTVDALPAPAPTITSFTATPSTAPLETPVVFNWQSQNAQSCVLQSPASAVEGTPDTVDPSGYWTLTFSRYSSDQRLGNSATVDLICAGAATDSSGTAITTSREIRVALTATSSVSMVSKDSQTASALSSLTAALESLLSLVNR